MAGPHFLRARWFGSHMPVKRTLNVLLCIVFAVVGLFLVTLAGLRSWALPEQRLPSEQTARQSFLNHRADYARLISLLRQVPGDQVIGNEGTVLDHGIAARLVPEYRELMRKIGAKSVVVRRDGSREFTIRGSGCAICSDSYMGLVYLPLHHDAQEDHGWTGKLVKSLDDKNLPRAEGSVADGLYLVPIESEWFIYRFEYHE